MLNLLWLLIELIFHVVNWRSTLPFIISVMIMAMMHITFPGEDWVWKATLPIVMLSIPLGIWWEIRDRPE
jgi:hypothetical protein